MDGSWHTATLPLARRSIRDFYHWQRFPNDMHENCAALLSRDGEEMHLAGTVSLIRKLMHFRYVCNRFSSGPLDERVCNCTCQGQATHRPHTHTLETMSKMHSVNEMTILVADKPWLPTLLLQTAAETIELYADRDTHAFECRITAAQIQLVAKRVSRVEFGFSIFARWPVTAFPKRR